MQTIDCQKKVCAFCDTPVSDERSICYNCAMHYKITIVDLKEDDGCGCDNRWKAYDEGQIYHKSGTDLLCGDMRS